MTLHEQVAHARDRLIRAGIARDEAALDARLLAQAVLDWDAVRFVTAAGESCPANFGTRYEALISRRERREPTAYITGHREFWGLDFEVSAAVLIPRPETELLVELTLDHLPERAGPHLMADVCTGSGCVAIALAREYPAARLVATDTSADALQVARRNALRHGVSDRMEFLERDLLHGSRDAFHLIVSNPPYVAESDRDTLPSELRYEPEAALFAGADGLSIIRRLVKQAATRLAAAGLLMFEFGFGQAEEVARLISQTAGLTMVGLKRDLQGIPRAAVARRTH